LSAPCAHGKNDPEKRVFAPVSPKLVVGGGVAANSYLRGHLEAACAAEGAELYIPSVRYCGDNAAMIACAAYYEYKSGKVSALGLDAKSTMKLD
jgi:N6-L-threonylcarbamoyladenine synthase